ncbi:hypothetical protein N7493_007074 [Penicillium malachiteum]|uniref:Uncharacterized protein n=1 Tax=Penicillium malachiteum TaxID=1324776 RepID=A0AAD6HKJ3_9EURO|nr:hypothetical protein N7493_007074 [Penicillium malachiteum]
MDDADEESEREDPILMELKCLRRELRSAIIEVDYLKSQIQTEYEEESLDRLKKLLLVAEKKVPIYENAVMAAAASAGHQPDEYLSNMVDEE